MRNVILFNVTAFIYFLSSIIFICHIIYNKNDKLYLAAKIFTICGFIIHTTGIIFRIIESGHAPFANLYESLIYFSWIIILFYIYAQFKYQLKSLGVFVVPLSFLAILYAKTFSSDIQPLVPILQSVWLEIHVAVIFIGYGGFVVSYGCALLYLLKIENKWAFFSAALNICIITTLIFYFLLKIKFNQGIISMFIFIGVFVFVCYLLYKNEKKLKERLPPIDVVDKVNYNAAVYGFIFLTGGIIAGAVWADSAWGSYWSWDPKETWSLITWFIYAAYLHARKTSGWSGIKAAYISVYGFWAVVFTYFGVNFLLPGLHSYN
ncbi:MAG: c-type cytochrome biogenesis protein CcsB [bacterium]|nr:c-type cytochrome biogenesis protein CcsB [bacterium]